MLNLNGKKVLVTGGSSMIGRQVVAQLNEMDVYNICPDHSSIDLTVQGEVLSLLHYERPDYIIHLAGYNGNIQFNAKYPADIYTTNLAIADNLLRFAHRYNVEKIVSIIPSCAYANADLLEEKNFLNGPPHPSVECHGFAKRILFEYSRQLYKQHGFNSVCCVSNNSYGPHDSFDLNKTKVIGSLIKKFVDAKKQGLKEVVCWGTGTPRREFVFSTDVATGLIKALQLYDDPMEVLNIGLGYDISINALAEQISELVGYKGNIFWDTTKPDGQMKKILSIDKMKKVLNWTPEVTVYQGLKQTIRWYEENYESINHGS